MRATFYAVVVFAAAILTATTFALTSESEVTSDYVRQHPDEFTVRVAHGENGLINFTVTHNVAKPMYHVARLAVFHDGKLVATSDTPLFGKARGNTFFFSLAAGDVAGSRFSLSDSYLDRSGEVPVPGTIHYQFRLADFLAEESRGK